MLLPPLLLVLPLLPLALVLPLPEVLVPPLALESVDADPLGCEVLPELAPVLLLGLALPVSELLLPVCPEGVVAVPLVPPVWPDDEGLDD